MVLGQIYCMNLCRSLYFSVLQTGNMWNTCNFAYSDSKFSKADAVIQTKFVMPRVQLGERCLVTICLSRMLLRHSEEMPWVQ